MASPTAFPWSFTVLMPRRSRRVFFYSVVIALTSCMLGCEKTDPDIIAGEGIVNQNCKVCHTPGLNNAPILGNRVMWKPRADQGLETLVNHASNGYGLMPAKGGNEALTETEMTQAIKYMLSLLESE